MDVSFLTLSFFLQVQLGANGMKARRTFAIKKKNSFKLLLEGKQNKYEMISYGCRFTSTKCVSLLDVHFFSGISLLAFKRFTFYTVILKYWYI